MAFFPQFITRLAAPLLLALPLALVAPAQAQTAPAPTDVIREITDAVGLKARFELRATREVDNAAAVVYNGKRFLLYNPAFLSSVNRAGHTDWAGISILAHEMGHHLNGHTLRAGGSQPADELEADEFSGFVLRKLGASLAQAQAAMATVPDAEGSSTHPGRTPRLAAISQGWQRASEQLVASARAAAPSATPAVVAVARPAAPVYDNEEVADLPTAASASPSREMVAISQRSGDAVRLVGQLTFRNDPSQRYYLTNALKVVHVDEDDNAEVVGRVTRTDSQAFPFVLTDAQQRRLFITERGDVYDKAGQRVAKLHDTM
ncbi:membrane-binding protein [Hymenobacter sp. DH14]|uniref:Membrane-binding protein n=1 Tax=Hymenobacter cyanobacteriorum TaxID=2926463 RepID=A0A9X1VC22_9BACT|nr:membrane-binding protein [Hymenobacter cyanobacteriorum]MCI1186344.1 membrane-binding protein [Hymenobacter cyanobacteriorum]